MLIKNLSSCQSVLRLRLVYHNYTLLIDSNSTVCVHGYMYQPRSNWSNIQLQLFFKAAVPGVASKSFPCYPLQFHNVTKLLKLFSRFCLNLKTWPYCYYWWYRNIITIPTDLNTVWLTWVYLVITKNKRYITPVHATKVISKLNTSTQVFYNVEILLKNSF